MWLLSCNVQLLNESIAAHKSDLSEVTQLGTELRQLAAVSDDVARLDTELHSIAERYSSLSSASDQRLTQMMEIPAMLSRFYVSHETIVSCVHQLETELSQRDVQPGPEAELHLQVSLITRLFLCSGD